jgi:REP element-mobilizing transposase RayT
MFTPYVAHELSVAYQLRWSLAIFPTVPVVGPITWTEELSEACEPDGIRVLDTKLANNNVLSLLLSTKPHVAPKFIVQRVKGRLQYLLRPRGGISWQRNFRLSTVGDANAQAVDEYIADQLGHHAMSTSRAQTNLLMNQWCDEALDLTKPINSAHGQYALGLHAVLVHAGRWGNAEREFVELTREAIRATLAHHDSPAARIALLADHVHISLRLHYDLSPSELIVNVMNEVCQAHQGSRLWMDGYYVGTVGAYNMAAVRMNKG